MNAIFNINRFASYLKLTFNTSRKHYLIIAGIALGLCLIAILFAYGENWGKAKDIFEITASALIVTTIVAPCIMEPSLNKNIAAINFIRPISITERFLAMFLKYVILIPLIALLFIYLIDSIIAYFDINEHLPKYARKEFVKGVLYYEFLYTIYGAQALFFLGYLYFRKYTVFKTISIIILSVFLISIIGSASAKIIAGEEFSKSFFELMQPLSFVNKHAPPAHWIIILSDSIFKIFFPVVLWIIAYFKLKETEI